MNHYTEGTLVGIAAALLAAFAGAGAATPAAATQPARTDQIETANIIAVRPGISGRIASIDFVQDQAVKKGDLLVSIDPVPLQKAFDKAQARLGRAQWRYLIAVSDRTRATGHAASKTGSGEELESRMAAAEQAHAEVSAAKTALDEARMNLDAAKVRAPVAGVVGQADVSVGTLVTRDQTQLTTVAPGGYPRFASN
jgi:RND family efflux transporter MFP subunit